LYGRRGEREERERKNRHRRHLQLAINKRSARRRSSRLFAAGVVSRRRKASIICDANKSPKNHGAERQK